jgi:predicted nucleic acid-binding protein
VSGDRIALDTSVAIDVLAATAGAAALLSAVSEHLLPAPVVGELRYGALNSRKAPENLVKVEALVRRCVVLNVTVSTAEVLEFPGFSGHPVSGTCERLRTAPG